MLISKVGYPNNIKERVQLLGLCQPLFISEMLHRKLFQIITKAQNIFYLGIVVGDNTRVNLFREF